MSQTSYSLEQGVAEAGLLYDLGPKDVISRAAEVALPMGRLAVAGTDLNTQAKLPTASTDITNALKNRGVTIRDLAREGALTTNVIQYAVKEMASLLRMGRIYVQVEQTVTPDSTVYVRYNGKAQVQTITFDADLVASNTINLKIDGVAMTEITYATSHDATMAAIAAQIQSQFNSVATATCPGSGSRVITVTSIPDTEIVISDIVVALGAGQANAAVAETVEMVLTTDRGKFRADVDSSTAAALPNAKYLIGATAGNFAVLELKI